MKLTETVTTGLRFFDAITNGLSGNPLYEEVETDWQYTGNWTLESYQNTPDELIASIDKDYRLVDAEKRGFRGEVQDITRHRRDGAGLPYDWGRELYISAHHCSAENGTDEEDASVSLGMQDASSWPYDGWNYYNGRGYPNSAKRSKAGKITGTQEAGTGGESHPPEGPLWRNVTTYAIDEDSQTWGNYDAVETIWVDIQKEVDTVAADETQATIKLTPYSKSPSGYAWTSSPAGLVGSGSGDTFTYNPAQSTPGAYTVTCKAVAEPSCADSCVVNILKVELEFQNTKMSSGKLIDPLDPPKDVRVGVIAGDTIKFKSKLTPSISLQDSDYTWTGIQNGNGSEIDITFNSVGTHAEQLRVLGCSERSARTTVLDVTGPGEAAWLAVHPQYWISAFGLRDEALAWASNNQAALGGGLHNGRADAARHAYWNSIMTFDWNVTDAEGFATAHEKTGLGDGNPHNETVMDLENNTDGRSFGSGGSTNRVQLQNAVITALNAGTLTILDDLGNVNEVGLLQSSNQ